MKTCPTCGRRASERIGDDYAKCEYPGDGITHGPMVEYVPTGYATAPCPDPLHDAADRVGEIVDVAELMLHAMALEELDESSVPMLRRFDELRERLRSALPEVPR